MKYVRYNDKTFPAGFDIADNVPKDALPLKSYIKPATWATEIVYSKNKGPPSYKIRALFTEEWWSVITPDVFIHRENIKKMLTEPEFNKLVAPFSDVGGAAKLLNKSNYSQVIGVTYLPGKPPGEVIARNELLINTHEPSDIKAVKGNQEPIPKIHRHSSRIKVTVRSLRGGSPRL